MATKTRPWTRADLARLPDDGNRYEVLDGELLVTPQASLPHQAIAARLMQVLAPYVDRHRLGVVVGPGAVVFGKNELQPDVLVVPREFDRLPEKWTSVPHPIFVAEVLSHSTRRRDLATKPPAYQGLTIPDYWVIDRFERRALVWTLGASEPSIVTTALRWEPRRDVEPLVISLADLLPSARAPQPIDDEE
ncbi:MAG: Uma2 family endonuclease [Gemmatimonadales bacterium]